MVTLSIPQLKKGDFVLISRKKYDKLLNNMPKKSKKTKDTKITKGHFLYEALQEVKAGKTTGPFNTVKEMMDHIESGIKSNKKVRKAS